MTARDRAREVGRLLEELLRRDEYAEIWCQHQRRGRPDGLTQAAVAQAIAEYLWREGEWDDGDTTLPRRLKDPVNRALRGQGISQRTLGWFIGAFEMAPADARRLRAALSARPLSVKAPANTLRPQPRLPIPQLHRTVAVFERRVIGRDGAPVSHHASRAIKAEEGTVRSYPCRQFTGAAEVIMLRGAKITARHEPPGSSPILEMTLSTPLSVGEVGSLEYQANFAPGARPVTEYRQVAHGRASHVDITVQFHRERLPARVWWTVWDNYRDGAILKEEPARLDPDGFVHRHLPSLENAAAGFRWEW